MSAESLSELYKKLGAQLAPDGIPLTFTNPAHEYRSALFDSILLDRSHEGRLELTGRDRLAIPHRLSTNDLESMREGERRATIFTNPNGRIIDRVTVYHRGDRVLMLTEPGRGEAVRAYLQRNIFFNDDLHITDLQPTTAAFALHGLKANHVMAQLGVSADTAEIQLGSVPAFVARDVSFHGGHWRIIVPSNARSAPLVWMLLLSQNSQTTAIPLYEGGTAQVSATGSVRLAGSLAYNLLRVRAGRPAALRELSTDYIPLEVGLWDEVSFTKGCYTGQEIIARMESRRRLAKTSVSVTLSAPLDVQAGAPEPLLLNGREVGKLTSSASDGAQHDGIAVVRLSAARVGNVLQARDVTATITGFTGSQPADLLED